LPSEIGFKIVSKADVKPRFSSGMHMAVLPVNRNSSRPIAFIDVVAVIVTQFAQDFERRHREIAPLDALDSGQA
jgi:hypothetical protein